MLVKAIGISPPSFYAAYGCKRALLARALERYGAGDGHFIADILAGDTPPDRGIEAVFLRAAEVFAADPEVRGCLVIEGTRNSADPQACALAAGALGASRAMLVGWISATRPDRAETLADYVLVALSGLSAQAKAGAGVAALRTSARIAAVGARAELDRGRAPPRGP